MPLLPLYAPISDACGPDECDSDKECDPGLKCATITQQSAGKPCKHQVRTAYPLPAALAP